MLCKQLYEIKAITAIHRSQLAKSGELGIPLTPIVESAAIKPIDVVSGHYAIFITVAGKEFALGLRRGGVREFSSVESAIKTCRTAGIQIFDVEFSDFDVACTDEASCDKKEG